MHHQISSRLKIMKAVKSQTPENFLIDFYLKRFQKRYENNETTKTIIIYYLMNLCFVLILFKYVLCLFVRFDYQTSLYLYDMAAIIGGIPRYNSIYLICVWILGLYLNIKFTSKPDKNYLEFSKILDQISGRKSIFWKLLDNNEKTIINKLTLFVRYLYKLLDISIVSFGKFFKILTKINLK